MNTFGSLLLVAAFVCSTLAAQPPCVCTRNIDQVCGSDGKTYDNECLLQCENYKQNTQTTVQKHGPCEDQTVYDPCTTCTLDYRPVCGSDGKDYSHKCVFDCAKKTQPELTFTDGPCEKKELCQVTLEYKPVCGSDGKEYPNHSAVECEKRSQPGLTYTEGPCKKA